MLDALNTAECPNVYTMIKTVRVFLKDKSIKYSLLQID